MPTQFKEEALGQLHQPVWYVENLTIRAWLFYIFPRLIRSRRRGRPGPQCLVFDASAFAFHLAAAMAWLVRSTIARFDFRITDIRDENGNFIRLRVTYHDLTEVQRRIVREELFQRFANDPSKGILFPFYLAKAISTTTLTERHTLTRALLIIQICAQARRAQGSADGETVFLERRSWLRAIQAYGALYGIKVESAGRSFSLRDLVLFVLSPSSIAAIRFWFPRQRRLRRAERGRGREPEMSSLCLAVKHHGHLNLDQPELYSDLFFWQNSELSGGDILALFWMPQIPVNQAVWEEISRHGIRGVALDPRCPQVQELPVFISAKGMFRDISKRIALWFGGTNCETKWLNHESLCYGNLRAYWKDLFQRLNVGIHVTWYWADGEHVAVAEALRELGGVSAMYQRSLDPIPSSEMAIAADVFFGFSETSLERHSRNGSDILYGVVTGYVGDHRFKLLRNYAAGVRDRLQASGAEKIVAYFDEDSADDRWDLGHEVQRENYSFLLEKLLDHSSLGLVLKPKLPGTLRARLGRVSELLIKAIRTGRCFVFEGGPLESMFPPAAAALASDVAINGHLCAATAGLEAALAGVPTLLLDREGWPVSPLYGLGIGRVVFKGWDHLWKTCWDHWNSGPIPGFGDWSGMLPQIDPFRDGRAAYRMGQYLHWILEDLKRGLGRDASLENAANRYREIWGDDKVRAFAPSGRPNIALPHLRV